MKILKNILVLAIFAFVISLAILGGTWATSLAAGTVPPVPRGGPGVPVYVVIPVTGAGFVIPVTGGEGAIVLASLTVCKRSDCPPGLDEMGTVWQATSAGQVTITSPDLIAAFKADPLLSIYWNNGSAWVKLLTTLVNGQLVAVVPGPGCVTFGKP